RGDGTGIDVRAIAPLDCPRVGPARIMGKRGGAMRSLLPRLSSEAPPPEYVAFVARHLADLRRDAEELCDQDADHFCTQVLTDVAVRWPWLELLRTAFGVRRAEDSYLRTALQRRSQQRSIEEGDLVPVQVWSD